MLENLVDLNQFSDFEQHIEAGAVGVVEQGTDVVFVELVGSLDGDFGYCDYS